MNTHTSLNKFILFLSNFIFQKGHLHIMYFICFHILLYAY